MDILKAEIARKRKQIEKAEVVAPEKKFFRRGDLAAKQQEEYWKKYYEKHGEKLSVEKEKRISEEEALRELEEDEKGQLSRPELNRRLRERSEPIILFGETEQEALRRLRKLELDAPDMKEGWKNDFQSAMDKVDKEYVNEVIQGLHNQDGRHDVQVEEKVVTLNEIIEMMPELEKDDNFDKHCEVVHTFFNHLLQRWGHDLNARPESVKRSIQGKFESATHSQTVDHLRPLIKSLNSKNCASDIIVHLVHIVKFMLQRDYIIANNAYMEMAIGNAPWPVGVTRSGIHQRPGSARMYVKNVAHVLNDETQRKFIQGLKRLMTKCQSYYPTDPSKSVEFIGKKG